MKAKSAPIESSDWLITNANDGTDAPADICGGRRSAACYAGCRAPAHQSASGERAHQGAGREPGCCAVRAPGKRTCLDRSRSDTSASRAGSVSDRCHVAEQGKGVATDGGRKI